MHQYTYHVKLYVVSIYRIGMHMSGFILGATRMDRYIFDSQSVSCRFLCKFLAIDHAPSVEVA